MAQANEADRVRQGGQFCSAVNCQSARYKLSSKGKRFHTFPKDEERCKIWMSFTRRKDFDHLKPSDMYGKGYCLCSDHFEESQYNCPIQKKSLVWNAVPTVFSIPNPPLKVTSSRKRPMGRMSKVTPAKQPRISQKAVVFAQCTEITVAGSEESSTMNKLTPFIKKEPEDFNSSRSMVQTDNDGFENKTEITMAGSEESSSVNKLTPFIKKEPEDFNSSRRMVQTDNDGFENKTEITMAGSEESSSVNKLTPFIKNEPEDFSSSWSTSMVQTDNDGFENKMETKVYPTGIYHNIHFAHLKRRDRR